MENKKTTSLENLKEKIAKEDPNCWNTDLLKKYLSELRLSLVGTKKEFTYHKEEALRCLETCKF